MPWRRTTLKISAATLAAGACLATALPQSAAQGSPGPLARAPDGRALKLTFNDDFDRPGPLGAGWRTTYGDGKDPGLGQRTIESNGERQLYVDRDYQARLGAPPHEAHVVRDGVLHIRAERIAPRDRDRLFGRDYVSGLINSLPFSQRYGYFEVRAKVPEGKGLWPALWMLPADLTWPPEIDIMESIGDPRKVFMTAHSKHAKSNTVEAAVDPGFHTYAVAWDARALVWYLDGREVARQPTPEDMHKPMYFVANLAVGGKWPGVPDASTRFPAELQIDYVRFYQFPD